MLGRESSLKRRLIGDLKRKSRGRAKKHRKTSRPTKAITEDLPVEGTTGVPMEDRLTVEEGRLIDKVLVEAARAWWPGFRCNSLAAAIITGLWTGS
jgi:hypothetical protein